MPCKRRKEVQIPQIPDFDAIMNFPLTVLVEDAYGSTKKMYMDANLKLLSQTNDSNDIPSENNYNPDNIIESSKKDHSARPTFLLPTEPDKENRNNKKKVNTNSGRKMKEMNSNADLPTSKRNNLQSSPLITTKFDESNETPGFKHISPKMDATPMRCKSILKNKISNEDNQERRKSHFNVMFSSPLVHHTPNNRSDLRRQVMLDQLKEFDATPILPVKYRRPTKVNNDSMEFLNFPPNSSQIDDFSPLPDSTRLVKNLSEGPQEKSFQVVKAEDRKKWMMEAKRRSRWFKRNQGMNDSFWEVYNVDNSESVILKICETQSVQTFTKAFPTKNRKKISKIGEGSFGEVFSIVDSDDHKFVSKFIPVQGNIYYNGAPQMTFDDIISEIVVGKELSDMNFGTVNKCRNFVQMKRVSLVCGKFPSYFQKEWDKSNKVKASENDNPKKFGSTQKWIVIQFEFAGCALEDFELKSYSQGYSILLQTGMALACAENYLEFEHRDLHWGNILIMDKDRDSTALNYILNGKSYSIEHHAIHLTIIDFTFSRIKKGVNVVYMDMSKDEDIFLGTGDLQFDVYRSMRAFNHDKWAAFTPKTNIFWLSYLGNKIISKLSTKKLMTDDHREEFLALINELDRFESANELIKHHLQ